MDAIEYELIDKVGTIIDGPRAIPAIALGAALDLMAGGERGALPPPDLPDPGGWGDTPPDDPWLATLWTTEHAAPDLLLRLAGPERQTEVTERAAALRAAMAATLSAADDPAEMGRIVRTALVTAVTDYVATVRAIHTEAAARGARSRARRTRRGLTEVGRIGRQIHMISVNASIEAARAGPAGRGFAVIGDEIRDLAAESAKVLRRLQDHLAVNDVASDGAGPSGGTAPAMALPPPERAAPGPAGA